MSVRFRSNSLQAQMGSSNPRYDRVQAEESDELLNEEKQPMQTGEPAESSGITWWKIVLGILLAAAAGAGITFAVSQGWFRPNHSHKADTTPAVTASSTISADPILATPHVDDEEKVDPPTTTPIPSPYEGQVLECGGGPEEARNNGCIFDVMMQDWVPAPCYDDALTQRYLKEGNWTWYRSGDANDTMTDEEMALGEHGDAWMSSSYHKAHCIFSWDKTVRALRNNQPISQELLSYDHVLHCSMQTFNGVEVDENIGVRAPTNYAKCALYGTWKENWIPDKHDSHAVEDMPMFKTKRSNWEVIGK
jgi:hypothetical protein